MNHSVETVAKSSALGPDDETTLSSEPAYAQEPSSENSFATRFSKLIKEEFADKFSPVYFVSIMGTGISSNILYNFPYPAEWLRICGIIMFGIAVVLFLTTTLMMVVSCWVHPERITQYHTDPSVSVFMGCYVMGYITLINFIHSLVGDSHIVFVWVLWWIAIASSVYTASIIVYLSFMSKLNKKFSPQNITATLLLPIVAITVVSSSGHLITPSLKTLEHKVITEIFSVMLWCISIALAFIIITIYFGRLLIFKIPNTGLIFSSWLPVGFLGQSSYSIMLFGVNMYQMIPDPYLGHSFLVSGALVSIFLLSFGYFMTFIAVCSIISKVGPFARKPNSQFVNKYGIINWNKGWWAMTFPCGTMSLSNFEISKGIVGDYELKFFKIMSCIFAVSLFTITIICLAGIVIYIINCIRGLFVKNDNISKV
ncbi:putative malate permease [Scheffersomyces xylosifermentans]|uniref:putative malate permease n=1 Tax=Scheffersomyces xylosifermentans TaxID=1304137 RepID=UPI00315C8A9F